MFNAISFLIIFFTLSLSAFELGTVTLSKRPFSLPPLAYSYKAMESFIDEETMIIHHTKHHQAYVTNLNDELKDNNLTLEEIIKKISMYNVAVRNNAGGHWNHSFFWTILSEKSDESKISTDLRNKINADFGSLDKLKIEFEKSAQNLFGSGWTWLILGENNRLRIVNTHNQDNPLMDISPVKGIPILGIDLWEHAYYLKYQNQKESYLKNFWKKVNWMHVSQYFKS